MPLQLEAVQANDGDCLLLHYGDKGLILIDGGSRGVYKASLRTRLEELRGSAKSLDLRLAVVSHIDADHITGILDLCKSMAESKANGKSPIYNIRSLWHNSFESLHDASPAVSESSVVGASVGGNVPDDLDLDESVRAVVASVKQGNELRSHAAKLVKEINAEFDGNLIKAPATGRNTVEIEGLKFTVIGPREKELNNLEKDWLKSKSSGAATEQSVAADYLNRTVPNLSSLVFLLEGKDGTKKRRMLLTGDAGGDLILEGLKSAKLLDAKGNIHVDLLKVQHHGSNHSVTEDFFRQVTADVYVISGNGKHGIPHPDTLQWLSNARAGKRIDVYMTNRKGDLGLTENLDKFLKSEKTKQPKHKYFFREEDKPSIRVKWMS